MTTPMPPVVSRSDWQKVRADLLVREKELTRLKDSVSAAQQPPYEWMRLADSD